MKNYYEILEISQKASPEVIDKAYKALVKKYHPDLQPENKKAWAEETLKLINEAHDVLCNAQKREKYDKELNSHTNHTSEVNNSSSRSTYQAENTSKKSSSQPNNNAYKQSSQENNYYSKNQAGYSSKKGGTNSSGASYNAQSQTNTKGQKKETSNVNLQKKSNVASPQRRFVKKPPISNNNYDDNINKTINEAYSNAYKNAYNEAYINTLKSMGYTIKYEKTLKDYIRIFFTLLFTIFFIVIISFIAWHIPPVKKELINLYQSNEIIKMLVDLIHNIIISFINTISSK